MKKIYLILQFLASLLIASCTHSPIAEQPIPLAPDLLHIDSLMQSSPDSALQMLLSFQADSVISTEAQRSGEISCHYQSILLSEALYKTDNVQSNRTELQAAMHYFDSLALRYPNNDDITMLSARSHYMNGVGYYEGENVVEACTEYLRTLDIMESHFDVEKLTDYKAKFMGLTYTRLGEMFFNYGGAKPALDSYKNALACFSRLSNYSFANTYRRIGCSYLLDNNNDTALYYYRKALCLAKKENKLSTYGASLSEISSIYYESGYTDSAYLTIREALTLPMNENQRLTRYHTLGTFFAKDCIYDSAIIYLEKSAKSDSYATRTVASELLMKCYQALGDTVNMQYYKNIYGEKMDDYRGVLTTEAEVTKIYESYMKNKRQREIIDKNRHRRTNIIVISTTVLVFVFVLLYFRKKKRITIPESFNERCAQFEQTEIFRNIRGRLSANNEKMSIKNIDGKSDMALTGADLMTLRTAVDKHFDNLTQRLARQYPELNATDINCLCLALIGLSNVEIAALLGVKYNSLTNRITRLKKILNTEDNIRIFLAEMQN